MGVIPPQTTFNIPNKVVTLGGAGDRTIPDGDKYSQNEDTLVLFKNRNYKLIVTVGAQRTTMYSVGSSWTRGW